MGHAGGVCRRSPSRERPQAKSLTLTWLLGGTRTTTADHWGRTILLPTIFFVLLFLSFFLSLACASASCSWHLLSFCFFFFSPRGRDVFVGGGVCNDRGLGPGLEAGPRLDKRGSPRGLVKLVGWSLLVVCGCWSQNGAALFQFSFVVVLSGASCSISVVVLCVWLELPYKRCFACVSSPVVVVVLCLS